MSPKTTIPNRRPQIHFTTGQDYNNKQFRAFIAGTVLEVSVYNAGVRGRNNLDPEQCPRQHLSMEARGRRGHSPMGLSHTPNGPVVDFPAPPARFHDPET
jgi:hypothetical protein